MNVGGECSIEGCEHKHMYNSTICYKHNKQKSMSQTQETKNPGIKDLWWTEDDESLRCDDTPETAVCEFDAYDGICWHCNNMVYPDIHLIDLILRRRDAFYLLNTCISSTGDKRNSDIEDVLNRILEPLIERDITSYPNLKPQDRVKAIQKIDDRDFILTELEGSFPDWKARAIHDPQFDLAPKGSGIGHMIHKLYQDIHAFNQEDWNPERATEWGLVKDTDTPSVETDSVFHWIYIVIIAIIAEYLGFPVWEILYVLLVIFEILEIFS